jgi:phospholipase/carboxylesterase
MDKPLLKAVTVGATAAHYSVIWLHGLGADGHDFEPIVPELQFRQKPATRFIFPHAPVRPVTINQGYAMPAWFDIIALDAQAPEDEAGIRAAADSVAALIAQEQQRGVPSEQVVLAGFSQGGALALHLGLRYPTRLAGILALSSYLPLADKIADEAAAANAQTPIFMAHGEHDPIVPLALAQLSRQRLQQLGYAPQWQTYPMEHSVMPSEINDIGHWLEQVLT